MGGEAASVEAAGEGGSPEARDRAGIGIDGDHMEAGGVEQVVDEPGGADTGDERVAAGVVGGSLGEALADGFGEAGGG